MIVLGTNSDDKGSQLEKLTRSLLEKRGYRNVCRNRIGAGGEEIDVQGEFSTPTLGHGKVFTLICECKAHRDVVSLPDWLKFCGKLYVARQTSNPETQGCFIALSGVNGNVKGSYDELREHKGNVELITGDDLLTLIRDVCPYLERRLILDGVKRLTERVITESDLAYREGQVYWLVNFEKGTYTILKADGMPLAQEEAAILCPIVQSSLAATNYVGLQEEVRAKERENAAQTIVLARLMVFGGKAGLNSFFDERVAISHDELSLAATKLLNRQLIVAEDGEFKLPDDDYKRIAAIFRTMLSGPCYIPVFGCEWYDAHINRSLFEEIRAVQKGMRISEEASERAIAALQLSPSALKVALEPIPMIANGMEQMSGGFVPENVAQGHEDHFMRTVFGLLHMDFMQRGLSGYFCTTRGIKELEVKGCHILKSERGIILQNDYRQRNVLGMMQGSDFAIHMIALPGMEEPWESPVVG